MHLFLCSLAELFLRPKVLLYSRAEFMTMCERARIVFLRIEYWENIAIGSNIAVKIRISAQFEPIVEGKLVLLSRFSERNVMTIETEILQVLHYHPLSNRGAIASMLVNAPSDSTMKRLLADAVSKGLIEVYGKGPATKYSLTPQAQVTMPLDIDTYFKNEMDDRTVQEMERLGVDLSWKSSQIEGNTYSLLETERLLKERQEATGKTREEAIMLLNHKDALDFVLNVPDYLKEISVHRIEDIHSLLTKDLGVERNIRRRRVGITGTNYRPLDNEFQIREALEDSCKLINGKDNIFEKSLLALVLLSYIQAFSDGNKRTARITSNAILIANGYCPISFRTVDSIDYKKAMLIFYEQNNIAAFKKIFIEQFEFAVKTYF